MATKIKLKRKTTTETASPIANVTLEQGEPLYDTNTGKLYIGQDGTTTKGVTTDHADAPTGFTKQTAGDGSANPWWARNNTELQSAKGVTSWNAGDQSELVFSKTGSGGDQSVNLSIDGNFYANYDGSIHKVPTYSGTGDTTLEAQILSAPTVSTDKLTTKTAYTYDGTTGVSEGEIYILPYLGAQSEEQFPSSKRDIFFLDLLTWVATYCKDGSTIKSGMYVGSVQPDSRCNISLYVYPDVGTTTYTGNGITRTNVSVPQYAHGFVTSLEGRVETFGTYTTGNVTTYTYRNGVVSEDISAEAIVQTSNGVRRPIKYIFDGNTTIVQQASYPKGFTKNNAGSEWWKRDDLTGGVLTADWQHEDSTGFADVAFVKTGEIENIALDGWYYGQLESNGATPAATGVGNSQNHTVVPAERADAIKVGSDYYTATLTDTTLTLTKK